jgi:hypothetical protein
MRARGGIGPAARFPAPSLETWPITSAHESKRLVQENATRLKKKAAAPQWASRPRRDLFLWFFDTRLRDDANACCTSKLISNGAPAPCGRGPAMMMHCNNDNLSGGRAIDD